MAPAIFEIELELAEPDSIQFQAGQFVNIHIPTAERVIMRPYSIVSPAYEHHLIRLCYKFIPEGRGTTYLISLKPGERVTFTGVFGHFVLDQNSKREIVFLATGAGIAPILSMIQTLYGEQNNRKAVLYFGVKTKQDIFYESILSEVAVKHPCFSSHICLSRDDKPQAPYRSGRIHKALGEDINDFSGKEAYICGSKEMVEEMKSFLFSTGMEKQHIFTEKFY